MKISDFVTNSAVIFTAIAAGFLVAWSFSGASKTTVQGVVQLDGQTVPWADVVFVSEDPAVEPIAVKANNEGQYTLNAVLPSGPYRVITRGTASDGTAAISRADELDEYQQQMVLTSKQQQSKSAKAIPESYGTIESSPLQTQIVDGESIQFNLQLTTGSEQLANGKANQSTTIR